MLSRDGFWCYSSFISGISPRRRAVIISLNSSTLCCRAKLSNLGSFERRASRRLSAMDKDVTLSQSQPPSVPLRCLASSSANCCGVISRLRPGKAPSAPAKVSKLRGIKMSRAVEPSIIAVRSPAIASMPNNKATASLLPCILNAIESYSVRCNPPRDCLYCRVSQFDEVRIVAQFVRPLSDESAES